MNFIKEKKTLVSQQIMEKLSNLENEIQELSEKAQFHLNQYNECVRKLNSLHSDLNEKRLNVLEFKIGSEIKVTSDIKIRNIIFYQNPVLTITSITDKFFYLKVKSGDVKIDHENSNYSNIKKVQLSKEEFSLLCDYSNLKVVLERERGLEDLI